MAVRRLSRLKHRVVLYNARVTSYARFEFLPLVTYERAAPIEHELMTKDGIARSYALSHFSPRDVDTRTHQDLGSIPRYLQLASVKTDAEGIDTSFGKIISRRP